LSKLRDQISARPQAINDSASSDSSLVEAILNKERKATAEFVSRYADDLYSYVRSRLAPQYDQVDDLVQEIFLAAWESLTSFQGVGSLGAWMKGIARHKVEDYYRARLRAPDPVEELDPADSALAIAPQIHELLEQDQLRTKTARVLASLPEAYRLALMWRYWGKASAHEMALKTGKTEKAIERLLARARMEFRERWNGE
jgi:RNA polymerase sigma-70 factor (ECF subfamily)